MTDALATKMGLICGALALVSSGLCACDSEGPHPMGHGDAHGAAGTMAAGTGAGGTDAAGAGAGSAVLDPHAGHHLPGAHANLPAAPPMLPSEPWTGELALPSFDDDNDDEGVVEVSLTAAPATVEFGVGKPTTVWAYNGSVPGPVLRAKVGDRIVVHFKNMLPEATTIHWHGLRVPSTMDGTAATQAPVQPGASFDYEFVALDAGTFWYHPHVRSDAQVEQGLYGAIVIEDAAEPLADMPAELMVLSDVLLDPAYALDTSTDERMMMMGREGNLVLVNGKRSGIQLPVRAGEPHRFRIVNAASARFFDLMVRGGTMMRIGGDRGLLEAPETPHQLLLVSGERADVVVWADQAGQVATISAEPFERAAGAGSTEAVDLVHLMASGDTALPLFEPPKALKPMEPAPDVDGPQRTFALSEMMHGDQVQFLINGAAHHEIPRIDAALGTSETWVIKNESDMDHPFHIHGFFFRPMGQREWKDTLNIPGNQSVTVMPYFDRHDGAQGSWMYHCHILGHAEGGMMGELTVR